MHKSVTFSFSGEWPPPRTADKSVCAVRLAKRIVALKKENACPVWAITLTCFQVIAKKRLFSAHFRLQVGTTWWRQLRQLQTALYWDFNAADYVGG